MKVSDQGAPFRVFSEVLPKAHSGLFRKPHCDGLAFSVLPPVTLPAFSPIPFSVRSCRRRGTENRGKGNPSISLSGSQ